MFWKLAITVLFFSLSASAEIRNLRCDYIIMASPLWTVVYPLSSDGTPPEAVQIIQTGGKPQQAPFYAETPAGNEYLHGWISKLDPNNSIEVFIYKEKQAKGWSKLYNPHMPIANEAWSDCGM